MKKYLLILLVLVCFSSLVNAVTADVIFTNDTRIQMLLNMSESSGSLTDLISGTVQFPATGTPDYQQAAIFPNSSYSINFDGSGEYFEAPNNELGDGHQNESWCVIEWLQFNVQPSVKAWGDKEAGGTGWGGTAHTTFLSADFDNQGLQSQWSHTTVADTPYLLATCYNHTHLSFWGNGTQRDADAKTGEEFGAVPLRIGGGIRMGGLGDADMKVGAVVVFKNNTGGSNALSAAEHLELYNNWLTPPLLPVVDTTPPITSNYNFTSFNIPFGDNTSIYTGIDLTPTITFNSSENALCAFSTLDLNYTGQITNSTTLNCTTTGGLGHTCTYPLNLSVGNQCMYVGCKDLSSNENATSTSGCLNVTIETMNITVVNMTSENRLCTLIS